MKKLKGAEIATNQQQRDLLAEYIEKKYLQIINWAAGDSNAKEPKDPATLLKALDGLCKHLSREGFEGDGAQESMLTRIIGLNQEKI